MAKKKTKKKIPSYLDPSKAKSRRAKLVKYAKENPAEAAALGLMAVPDTKKLVRCIVPSVVLKWVVRDLQSIR